MQIYGKPLQMLQHTQFQHPKVRKSQQSPKTIINVIKHVVLIFAVINISKLTPMRMISKTNGIFTKKKKKENKEEVRKKDNTRC